MDYIRRHIESCLLELSQFYGVILLTGPRQAGKTTMFQELAEKEYIGCGYVTLDNLAEHDTIHPVTTLELFARLWRGFMPGSSADKRLTRVFGVIDKGPLQLGTCAVLCMTDKLSAFDSSNLIVPIWMI